MAFPQGINFRATSGYVSDPTNTDYEIGTTANYPRTTAQGNNVGWLDAPNQTRNRSTGVDARLAGVHVNNAGSTNWKRYRVDLPSTGNYYVRVAQGDASFAQNTGIDLYDNTSSLGTLVAVSAGFTAGGEFYDATGVKRTSAANWVSSNAQAGPFTFSTTTLIVQLNGDNAATRGVPISHLWIESAGGGITLTINDATHGHTADGLSLTQQHQLAVQDATHAHAVDNLALTQQHELAVDDATHAHSADNLTLSTEVVLSIADALHGHSVDNITLVQQHVLVVDDATHGHSADNVVLETGTNLAIADALHAHTVDNLALTQQHVLVVADAFHQHSADNLVLGGLPVAEVEEGGGGPDREESEQPAERFTNDASGWRKPKWVREREQLAAAARISTEEQQDAEPRRASPVAESLAPAVSDSGDAGVAPGLERVSPQPPAIAAPEPQRAAVELERARIAAKVRQQRELEEIMTVLMMAA